LLTDQQCHEECSLVPAKSGKHLLQDPENYLYYKDKMTKVGRIIWKCIFYNKQLCRSRVKTVTSLVNNRPIIVERIGFHSHLANTD
jgi:hypothetical protein